MTQPNLVIVPFEPWHVSVLNLRKDQREVTEACIEQFGGVERYGALFVDFAVHTSTEKLCYSALLDGVVIYCGGLTWDSLNVATAWSLVSDNFLSSSFSVRKKVLNKIKEGIDAAPVRRVQAYTDPESKDAGRYLEYFGMSFEGTLKGHGINGKDENIYGMVKDEQ